MDIIKCKAKSTDNKKWLYGYPVKYPDGTMCLFSIDNWESFSIIPETLCYSTGENDINGRELFIGDTINDFGGGVYVIDYDSPDYDKSMAFPPTKCEGDKTRLGNIVFEDGTVRIQTVEMDYCYNLSKGAKLSDMEFVSNIWDLVYP